jgi:hypothetical protein
MPVDKLTRGRPRTELDPRRRPVAKKSELAKTQNSAVTRAISPTQWRKNYEEVIADTIRMRRRMDFWASAVASALAVMSLVLVALQLR